jgi:hypothetical protein
MGAGRMAVIECAKRGDKQIIEEIKQFINRVRKLPPASADRSAVNEKESTIA